MAEWLRDHQLPTPVIWGTHDLAFTVAGAEAFRRDLSNAEIAILDGGHFVMDNRLGDVVNLSRKFLTKQIKKKHSDLARVRFKFLPNLIA